ncbi:MAG: hypothetical protein A2270_02780 [Elusimicrobia bacterium RIFOXYA12_FULL_51_18]|nr:MAG: hypothetical protein A2270_02780 [Elusimicrobia bacterium RIFOXYA12_FULL_51_18]OGS28327.1 MAG: hypothetical protein A2218_00040 [Elusimicrobia bacterium RIFOXYA2_FULL_53_38]
MGTIKEFIKKHLPKPVARIVSRISGGGEFWDSRVISLICYPFNMLRSFPHRKYSSSGTVSENNRIFDYRRQLLPNHVLAEQENGVSDAVSAAGKSGLSIGYPAWNLLYYSLLCSPSDKTREFIAVETGTNLGYSTIAMAQALKDMNAGGCLHTVDLDGNNIEAAKLNVEKAGLSEYVKFHKSDAILFLKEFVKENEYMDFVFIDDKHEYSQVKKEFHIIYPRVLACAGKVYFDNTSRGGVCHALRFIRKAYPGNMIEFNNCSWGPPGNAIWQP